ncbi:hypothetical protein [uncultured Microscilla sp.]|uniref:hypothetical protein n=1 Tax=uncultured Microscilla sp. TaxID=432653 RepID=UPI00261D5FCF|nr:hypothetical protein [uncultured Microscilla sp.]
MTEVEKTKKNEVAKGESFVLPGGVTQTQVNEWKKKYRNVHQIQVPTDDTYEDWLTIYIREPNREVLNEYLRKSEKVPIDAALALVRNTFLGGDEEVKKESKFALAAVQKISSLIIAGEARIKKL